MADPIFGTAGDDVIDGTGGNDWIQSLGGDDIIRGNFGRDALWSGSGNDIMVGGDFAPGGDTEGGNDTYHITSLGDVIIEFANEGRADRIMSYISYDMAAAAEVEHIRLVGFDFGLDAIGNDLDNTMEGNREYNIMFGGLGNDSFVVYDTVDLVDGEAGSNTVVVDFSAFLGMTANWVNIQNITLTGSANLYATGDAGANILTGNLGSNKLTGGAGDDTYVVGTVLKDKITELAGGGIDTVITEVTYSLAKIKEVENLTLAMEKGPMNGFGNALVNVITGNESGNTLDGLGGADTMIGGEGSDTYIVDNAGDVVDEGGGSGIDLVISSVSFDLNDVLGDVVENLTLSGKKAAINGTGTVGDNTIIGNDGNNIIDGGGAGIDWLDGGKGNDVLIGGSGNNTYIVDSHLDVATEGGTPGGTDIVMANIKSKTTFILDTGIESLTLTGKNSSNGIGNDLGNTITGNAGSNILSGLAGDDTIIGVGGKNTMAGGDGDDTLTGGNSNDIIHGDDGNDSLIGGGGNDILIGDDGNDELTGGAGKDTLAGGDGNDLYIIDTFDTLIELPGAGIDTVRVTFDFALGPHFDNLSMLAGTVGIGNVLDNSIAGNATDNTLLGGGGNDILYGESGEDTLNGGAGDDTMIGGLGNDTFFVDSALDIVTEGLTEGTLDTILSSVTYDMSVSAPGEVEILQLTGSAALDATGNDFDNTLIGNAGVNTLVGGLGGDSYVVDLSDTVIDNTGEGFDTIITAFNYTLGPSAPTYEIEGLTLTGFANVNGTGNDLDNHIQGNAGINTLAGTTGNDTYVILSLAETQFDVIIENIGEGTADTIKSAITYVLGPTTATYEIENLTLIGMDDIHGVGNDLDNTLRGNIGDNTLDGSTGADTMFGGEGDDTFIVDNVGDVTEEFLGEGNDSIFSSVDFDMLSDAPEIENLTLTGMALVGVGNDHNNVITGNNSDNTLSGGLGADTIDGKAGADTMIGGVGNDIYIVDNPLDVITELAAEGIDRVLSSASYDMSTQATGEVEVLTLTGGLLNINATGNAFDNTITGNDGDNTIDGSAGDDTLDGGLGFDTLIGGLGDDIFVVTSPGKTIIENPGGGTADEVQINATYTLEDEIEILTLTGMEAINGFGNVLDNTLEGNSASNTLDGLAGADTMMGMGGNDVYMVDNALDVVDEGAGTGVDHIFSTVSFDMGTQTVGEVDNITLLGAANINATGNGFDNSLVGNSGINILAGGGGDDTYFVTAGDSVIEVVGEGTLDTIITDISWVLAAGEEVERIILTEAGGAINATGNELENTLVGNSAQNTFLGGLGDDTYDIGKSATLDLILPDTGGSDTVRVEATYSIAGRADLDNITLAGTDKSNFNATGNAGVNVLKGTDGKNILNGAAGADTMLGGKGDDIYHVDDGADVIDEAGLLDPDLPGGGKDLVISTVSYSMYTATAMSIENLTLVGPNAFNGTGNSSANIIKGNSLDNYLDGREGADTLEGYGGNDTYVIDSGSDVIKDTSGIDWVISTLPFYTLANNLENLALAGPGNPNGNGNNTANSIIGNNGDNIIDGGRGADYMAGSGGDDIIFVDSANDVVVELAGEGTMDVIKTKVNFVLDDTQYVEVVEHIGNAGNLTGNSYDNTLIGNKGTNTLMGGGGDDTLMGGAGKDIYFGGTGSDTFEVDYFGKGVDVIKDYEIGIDDILFGVDIDPLLQVSEDFIEYKHVGLDTYVYLDFDSYMYDDYGPKLVAIIEGVLV